jgi:hypothetical protein
MCSNAFAAGKQYTIRLVPDFFIPRCVIRLDYLVEAAKEHQHETDIEWACELLGCVDTRTAHRHFERLEKAVGSVVVDLAERRALMPELGELPKTTPETPALTRLETLYDCEIQARVRAGDSSPHSSLRQQLQAAVWKIFIEKPSGYASGSLRPP